MVSSHGVPGSLRILVLAATPRLKLHQIAEVDVRNSARPLPMVAARKRLLSRDRSERSDANSCNLVLARLRSRISDSPGAEKVSGTQRYRCYDWRKRIGCQQFFR